jgi:hypothetical protein
MLPFPGTGVGVFPFSELAKTVGDVGFLCKSARCLGSDEPDEAGGRRRLVRAMRASTIG